MNEFVGQIVAHFYSFFHFDFVIHFILFFSQAPDCSQKKRSKRDTKTNDSNFDEGHPATIEVYSGLYVNENAEITEGTDDSVFAEKVRTTLSCHSIFTIFKQNQIRFTIIHLYSYFTEARRCAVHIAKEFCHRYFNSWPNLDAVRCSGCALYIGSASQQNGVQLRQLNL